MKTKIECNAIFHNTFEKIVFSRENLNDSFFETPREPIGLMISNSFPQVNSNSVVKKFDPTLYSLALPPDYRKKKIIRFSKTLEERGVVA